MKEITLKIKESKFKFFMELIKSFDFVQIDEGDSKEDVLANIDKGLKEVQQYKQGKLKTMVAEDLIDEL